jgi:nucleoside 2-deoxyribosyltransferase
MAFGRPDTDAVYDTVIARALREEGVTPVRVDRREHNRNINDVIIEELQRSDVVLADLTYARPSVYFEAGFGERAVPVIYTVRADHLEGSGEFRVHFDVSMRNIVAWRTPDDAKFVTQLRRRLRHVLQPVRARRKDVEERRARELEFTSRPHREQLELLRQAAVDFFASNGLSKNQDAKPAACEFHLQVGRVLWSTSVLVLERWVRNRMVADWLTSSVVVSYLGRSRPGIDVIEHHVVFVTISAVPFSKMRNTFPDAHADAESKIVSLSRKATQAEEPERGRRKRATGPAETIFVHVIDSVKSRENLVSRLAQLIPRAARTVGKKRG